LLVATASLICAAAALLIALRIHRRLVLLFRLILFIGLVILLIHFLASSFVVRPKLNSSKIETTVFEHMTRGSQYRERRFD